jgi:hypothetical protein
MTSGVPPLHPTVSEAIRFMAKTGLPMRRLAADPRFWTLDDPVYDERYDERKRLLRSGEQDPPFKLGSEQLPFVGNWEMKLAVDEGLVAEDGDKRVLTPEGWAHGEPFELQVTSEQLDAVEAALESVEPLTERGQAYAQYLLHEIERLRRDTKAWKKPKGAKLSRPALDVLSRMADANLPIERHSGGFWRIGPDTEWSTAIQTVRSLEKKGMIQQMGGDEPEWKAPRVITDKGREAAGLMGSIGATWRMTRADAAELWDWLGQAIEAWSEAIGDLEGADREAFAKWQADAEKVRLRLSAATHYVYDERDLVRYNDPEGRADVMAFHGGYRQYRIEIVPISAIEVPEVWSEDKFVRAFDRLRSRQPTDPIHADESDQGVWDIADGIHRTNASIALGYTHVPVLTSTFVETPDALVPEEPEHPKLSVGDWVRLAEPSGGAEYGWVSEYLYTKTRRGVKRRCYGLALVTKGSDWPTTADFCDHEFEPIDLPPTWAIRAKSQAEDGGWQDS